MLDFVGGREDLEAGVVRAIGDPARAVCGGQAADAAGGAVCGAAWVCDRGGDVCGDAGAGARDRAGELRAGAGGADADADGGRARRAFELLDEAGLLREVLPEVVKMHGVEQPPEYHPEGDVWVHTMMLLEKLAAGVRGDAGVGGAAA